jgi:DNA invertase Pin-like site-specific DNA recombinase
MIEMEAEMNVYDALIRVSKMNGRSEADEATMTIRDQEAAIAHAIAARGGRRGKTFKAIDQSGFTIHESEVYPALLERVRTGKSAGFVVAYGDRLSRNWRTVGKFFDDLEAVDAEYIDASAPEIDYRTDEGRMLTGMKAVMGEVPSLAARTRGRRIADLTVARGVPNRVPYGYRRNADLMGVKTDPNRDGKALVPDEATAPIIRRIFELRLDGYGWAPIASTLNEAGVPSPAGGHWVLNGVRRIVKNEVYAGTVVLGERRLEGAHEPLVRAADWRRAQGTPRAVIRNGRIVTGIAGGLLVCTGCDRPLTATGANSKGYLHYGCRAVTGEGRCPRPVYVSKARADEYVEEAVRDALSSVGELGIVASARELEVARLAVERARAEKEAFVKNASILDADDFRAGYETRKARELEAAQVYDDLAARAADAAEMPSSPAAFNALPLAQQRRVAQSLIERIAVSPPLTRSRFADVALRFDLEWKRSGETARAGR